MAHHKKSWLSEFLSGPAFGVICGVLVALIGWNADTLGIKKDRESFLEEAHERLLRENASLLVQNGLLKVQKEFGPQLSERDALFRFINSIRRPGWCKEATKTDSGDPSVEDLPDDFPLVYGIVFPMRHVNPYYAQAYGKSYAFYVGRLDFAIYPRPIAEQYHINDRRVFTYKSFEVFAEGVVYASGRTAVEDFWKFHHALADGSEFICGWQITWNDAPLNPAPTNDRRELFIPEKRRDGIRA